MHLTASGIVRQSLESLWQVIQFSFFCRELKQIAMRVRGTSDNVSQDPMFPKAYF